jgi:mercuric ion transport protein
MNSIVHLLTRLGDKTGSSGVLVSAMGCSMCFPAIASLGAALGLGFLSQWEGFFISTLLPLFAWFALIINGFGWFSHKQWHRSLLGISGPALLMLSLYPFFQYEWSTYVSYVAITLMVAVSLWDLFSPANKRCSDQPKQDTCATNIQPS